MSYTFLYTRMNESIVLWLAMWEISLLVIINIVNNIPIRLKNLDSLIRDIFQLVSQTESVLRCLWNNIYNVIYIQKEKVMAPHSSTLAWKILWMEEPGRLQSMGSLRVGYDWATSLSLFTFMHWRRRWQPTPVFLLGESQGRGSLMSCRRLWGHTESEMTEAT